MLGGAATLIYGGTYDWPSSELVDICGRSLACDRFAAQLKFWTEQAADPRSAHVDREVWHLPKAAYHLR